ncbi:MAG: type II secretion system F family protein, partial [Pseudomonadota bacterium]
VRGVRSGLPVNECMQIIANESPKPVCDEFRLIVEGQFVGMDMEQCLDRMFERMPTPEVNFFAIVLTIQAKTGGNLSEALANLSKVLRARKQLRAKVQAMSAEAKAGALIIGSLPFLVGFGLYMISSEYIELLFTHKIGHIMLIASAVWMSLGILVMRQMINFKI